jgi:hypothetical protein
MSVVSGEDTERRLKEVDGRAATERETSVLVLSCVQWCIWSQSPIFYGLR